MNCRSRWAARSTAATVDTASKGGDTACRSNGGYQIGGQGRPVWMRGVLIRSQAGGKSCLAACGVHSHRFEILVKPNGQFRTACMATIWPFRHRIAHVKPCGRLRRGYMALIAPFGHWVAYPTVVRQIESASNTRERKER